uniref:RING-type domain-containing protein n=1 Tax=Oryza rufipogon TaxID=4529 RepID=A0A0E0NSU2_ORYRU
MAFFSHHHLQQPHPQAPPPPPPQQQQQQPVPPSFRNALPVPVDGQIPAPLPFFNPPPAFQDQPAQPPLVDAMGLTAAAGLGWRQPREQELLGENSQMSSIDFLQTGSAVSTGLALSLEDRRHGGGSGAGAGNSSGDSPLLLLPMLDDDISREVQRLDADMDRFIKAQSERLRQSILEKVQAKQFEALASVEDKILRKIRDKEAEVENINKRNSELEDQIKQLAVEVGAWQQRAKYNESMINALKYNLEQVCAHQSKDFKEGCGDSEVDDTASCCNGGAANLQLMPKENRHSKDLTACRVCKSSEACMLLLPCRHLCLCKECESKLSFCPLCQSSKILGMEIYM